MTAARQGSVDTLQQMSPQQPYLNVDHKVCGQQTSERNLPPRELWRHHQIKGLLWVKQCVLDLSWVDYGS